MNAFGALFLLEVLIAFSFIVSGIFMFIPKSNPGSQKIFFGLAAALAIYVTVIDATALPATYVAQIVIAWLGLIPAGVGVIIAAAKGKPTTAAKLLVMASTVYGALGYFFLA